MTARLRGWFSRMSFRNLTSVFSLTALVLFQLLFLLTALSQTPLAHFKEYSVVDGVTLYHTASVDIHQTLINHLIILIAAECILYVVFQLLLETSPMPVLAPVFVLLTISLIFQTYINAPSVSRKHFILMLASLAAMVFGAVLAKFCSEVSLPPKALKGLLWCLLGLCGINILLGLLHPVNGSGAFVSVFGMNFQPGELFKLLVVAYSGIAFTSLKEDLSLRRFFLLTMGVTLLTLLAVRDLGNAVILLVMLLVVIYMLYGVWRMLFFGACCGIFAVMGYHLIRLLAPDSYIVKRFSDTFQALSSAGANANLRRALLSVVRSGLFGRGLTDSVYATNNYAANCDFCFDTILSVFGIGAALLIVASYAVLVLSCRLKLSQSGQDMAFYTFSNMLMTVISTQAIIHIGGNCNILPLTGVCLPLISAGGSNMLCSLFCIGLSMGCRISDLHAYRMQRVLKKGYALLLKNRASVQVE